MREKAYLVVGQLCADAMIAAQGVERHVGTKLHGTRCILKTHQRHSIGPRHIQLILLAYGGRVKRRLQRPIVGEGRLLLGLHMHDNRQEKGQNSYFLLKHVYYNAPSAVLLHLKLRIRGNNLYSASVWLTPRVPNVMVLTDGGAGSTVSAE